MGGFAYAMPNPLRGSLLIVAALVLSGCAGPASGAGSAATPSAAAVGDPTDETGVIRAQVVTSELIPVENAIVLLASTDRRALTDIQGVAVFADLEPGTYTVVTAKTGYEARQPKGKVVDVRPAETSEVSLELEPGQVADAANTYHTTFPFTGFLTCTVQVYPLAAQTCGRQTALADPNGRSNHVWKADSALAQTVVMEVDWTPTISAAPFQLNFIAYAARVCSPQAPSCSFDKSMFSAKGSPPIYGAFREDQTKNLTKRISPDGTGYPKELYAETLVHCPPPSCYASVVLQQKYQAWITVFYGEQAPQGWSIIPK